MLSKYFQFKRRYIPILKWLPNYTTSKFKNDFVGGITVGIMLIPQGMAYAVLADLPAIYGLYAAIIPCFIYFIFGSSRQLSVGPTAMISILVASGVGLIADKNTEIYIQLAITLSLMVGVIQILLGFFRLGFLVNYLSHPVISGFTSAAALIIGISQLKHLLGIDLGKSKSVFHVIYHAIENITTINPLAVIVGLSGIIIILLLKKYLPFIPGALVAVVIGITATWFFSLEQYGLKIVGEVPKGLPSISLPNFEMSYWKQLFPIAVTISLIGYIESIAIAKAMQNKHRSYKLFANQELAALGLMNIFGSLFQAYPTTGSFSRTAVNDQNGAKTPLASLVTGVFISITLIFLTTLFYYLPKPILASIIMVSVYGLFDIKEAKHLWFADREDFWVLVITFLGTLILGIEEGILIGVVVSMGIVIYESTRPYFAVLGKIPHENYYKDVSRFSNLTTKPESLILRFEARLYFGNVTFFKRVIDAEIKKKKETLKALFLDASSINTMDSTGYRALEEVVDSCREDNIDFYLIGIKGTVRDEMKRSGLMRKIGKDRIFIEIHHAICHYNNHPYKDFSVYVTQTEEEFIDSE